VRPVPELCDMQAPAPLRDLPYWLLWRYETRPGETKPRKVPYYPSGERRYGQQGSPSDLARLTTFSAAREAAVRRGMEGVGFAHTQAGGIITLDFDKCVVDGKVDPTVLALVQGTYAEFSPSGTGVHAIFAGPCDVLANSKSYATPDCFGVEAFSSVGFTTFSGWMLDHVDLVGLQDTAAPLSPRVIDYCRERFGRTPTSHAVDPDDFTIGHEPKISNLHEEDIGDLLAKLDPDMGRDEWIRVGMAVHHQTDGSEDGFWLWNDWSEQGGKYNSEESLRQQWESFDRPMAGRRRVTMATVLGMVRDLERGTAQAVNGGDDRQGADWSPPLAAA
jgi:putative DNA primase/helicase